MSGRFVAPRTTTPLSSCIPSISAKIWLTIRSVTCGSPKEPPRRGARESNSSKKMTAGGTCRARWKNSAIFFSDSPYHLESSELPLAERKLAPDWVATALATRVLPVPGGP